MDNLTYLVDKPASKLSCSTIHFSGKRPMMANGLQARPSVSQHSSISQGDDAFSPYARVNYDQLQKQEHPYARLQNNSHIEESSSEEPSIRASLLRYIFNSFRTKDLYIFYFQTIPFAFCELLLLLL